MDINSTTIRSPQQTTTPTDSPSKQPSINQQTGNTQDSTILERPDLTVNLTGETFSVTTTDEPSPEPKITSSKQAQEISEEFTRQAANDPSNVQLAQSNSLTSETVQRLIG